MTTDKERSILLECVSLQPSKKQTLSMPDWSLLPGELLHLISTYLENCFDVIHARSVCHPWRATFPFPSFLLRPSYTLPDFVDYPRESKDLCTIEKVPLFLFRTRSPSGSRLLNSCLGDYKLESSDDHMVLPYPLQCSVEVKIPRYEPTLMNLLDCQVFPLGHQYRMIGWDLNEAWKTDYRAAAFLPLNNDQGGGEFCVLLSYRKYVLVLRSDEMRWMQINNLSQAPCDYVMAIRGRFYVAFLDKDIFVINPYSLEATLLMPLEPLSVLRNFMVPSADDELFLVEEFIPYTGEPHFPHTLRVSRLDEKAGKWIVVRDLEDRVLFINGKIGNCSCAAKELPDCCGVSGNSVLIVDKLDNATYSYKYVVHKGDEEDDLSYWKFSAYLPGVLLGLSPML